jgi:hypothetical protein
MLSTTFRRRVMGIYRYYFQFKYIVGFVVVYSIMTIMYNTTVLRIDLQMFQTF